MAGMQFVDTPAGDDVVAVRIFTPAVELPLAGHPLVGTTWLLDQAGRPAAALLPPAGRVEVTASEHHAEIVAALARHDGEAARHAMRAHLEHVEKILLKGDLT